jgi:hypothetical protein
MWRGTILLEDYRGLEVTGVEDLKTRIRNVITTINREMLARTWEELGFLLDVLHATQGATLKCAECMKKRYVCTHQIKLVPHFSWQIIIFNEL